jgi:peptidoglycan/LPS O-acetylase OafA/YrhL
MDQAADDRSLERKAYLVCLSGGTLLWLLTAALTGRSEAWDSPYYWSLAYPLSILLAGVVAYHAPRRAWRWGLAVMLVQALVMVLTSGGAFGLLPLGLLLFGVLSLPAMALAVLVARWRTGWARG